MNDSKSTWDKLVSGKELASTKTLRNKSFVVKKERAVALGELQEEGWELLREYKDPKYISVKKDKPYDECFEDKVWMLFAQMGFIELNRDRNFILSYDDASNTFTQQIDVFAVDEETVVVVECKAAGSIKDGVFKKQIEAFYGQTSGLRKEILKKYPKRKVKFIWATQNYIMSKADLSKLNEWDIAYFSDAIVDYYLELIRHIGSCARYQLLGNLFANQTISNMEEKIPAIQGKMGGYTYYSFSIEPERLLKIGYVLHRNEANKNMMPTYQRIIKKKRLKEVQSFITNGGYFPNSLVISIDSKGRGLTFEPSSTRLDNGISKLGILHLPKRYRSAYIIDGQHRLYGYSDSRFASTNCIPVVAFIDLDRNEQIKLFMEINENQKAVPKTLRVTLNSDMLWDSDDFNERRLALRSKIAQMLGEEDTSPLLGRIVVGENESSPIKCITVEAIQSAFKKCHFFTLFDKKNSIIRDGTFDLGENQNTLDIFYPFIEECLRYIKNNCEAEWNKEDGELGLITINRGIQAIVRVIDDIINHVIRIQKVHPKINSADVQAEVKYYIDPLLDFLNSATFEQRKDLRGYFGGGADTRFWRSFQRAISSVRSDFQPEGMDEYWKNDLKTYNQDSILFLRDIEEQLKSLVSEKLEGLHGENWVIKGTPKPVYSRAKKEADDQNYDIVSNGQDMLEVNVLDCLTFADIREIVIFGRNWSEVFEKILVPPLEESAHGDKKRKTEWISDLYTLNNKLTKTSYGVTTQEFEKIEKLRQWLNDLH